MSQGLKNLQTSARSCARRECNLETPSRPSLAANVALGGWLGLDDSGIDLDADYDEENTTDYPGKDNKQVDGNRDKGFGSLNMGIDGIINRSGDRE
jgi:hypothetical protein